MSVDHSQKHRKGLLHAALPPHPVPHVLAFGTPRANAVLALLLQLLDVSVVPPDHILQKFEVRLILQNYRLQLVNLQLLVVDLRLVFDQRIVLLSLANKRHMWRRIQMVMKRLKLGCHYYKLISKQFKFFKPYYKYSQNIFIASYSLN